MLPTIRSHLVIFSTVHSGPQSLHVFVSFMNSQSAFPLAQNVHCTYPHTYLTFNVNFSAKSSLIYSSQAGHNSISLMDLCLTFFKACFTGLYVYLLIICLRSPLLEYTLLSARILTVSLAIVLVPRRVLLSLQAGPLLLQRELKYYLCGYTVVGKKWLEMSLIEVRVFRKL